MVEKMSQQLKQPRKKETLLKQVPLKVDPEGGEVPENYVFRPRWFAHMSKFMRMTDAELIEILPEVQKQLKDLIKNSKVES